MLIVKTKIYKNFSLSFFLSLSLFLQLKSTVCYRPYDARADYLVRYSRITVTPRVFPFLLFYAIDS